MDLISAFLVLVFLFVILWLMVKVYKSKLQRIDKILLQIALMGIFILFFPLFDYFIARHQYNKVAKQLQANRIEEIKNPDNVSFINTILLEQDEKLLRKQLLKAEQRLWIQGED